MQVAFSTVVRSAPPDRGGEVILLDWDTKSVVQRAPVSPSEPPITDPNPRGNSRGGRGIVVVGDDIWVASYHSLLRFDRRLRPLGRVSHPLFAGLHELSAGQGDVVWAAATSIDAAVGVHLSDGSPAGDLHPRDMPAIANRFGVRPMDIDRGADNRTLHLARERADNVHHLHLNAVRVIDGDVHALFSRVGAVANLSRGEVVMQDPYLRTAHPHNLVLGDDGRRYVSDTNGPGLRIYRPDWTLERAVDVRRMPWVRRLALRLHLAARAQAVRAGGRRDPSIARPLFGRGLAVVDEGLVLVGISPATLLLVDVVRGRLVDHFALTDDVRVSVHGIAVVA